MQDSREQTPSNNASEFVEKLRRALKRDGDFPASAKVVSELRMLVSQPGTTANQITELILREPSLGTRVLHLVNSSFYRRAKPIMTVSHAVVQIGMRPLAELCAGLVLLQKFIPAARQGGSFAHCLKKTITTSLLCSSISKELNHPQQKTQSETGYLAGTFYEMGVLLLAFYFPQIHQTALKRSETKKQPISTSIQQLTGLTAVQLSIEVIEALNLPSFYRDSLLETQAIEQGQAGSQASITARTLSAAHQISEVMLSGTKEDLERLLRKLAQTQNLPEGVLSASLGKLHDQFKEHCHSLQLTLPELPEYLETFSPSFQKETVEEELSTEESNASDAFMNFVEEIRESVRNQEPTAAVITAVMETLAWALGFDRVLLLLFSNGKQHLRGRMSLGDFGSLDPKEISRPIGNGVNPHASEAKAVKESRPIFHGDPIFEDGWPFVSFPVGYGDRTIGVIYADRVDKGEGELGNKEQAAIGVLSELLDRSLGVRS